LIPLYQSFLLQLFSTPLFSSPSFLYPLLQRAQSILFSVFLVLELQVLNFLLFINAYDFKADVKKSVYPAVMLNVSSSHICKDDKYALIFINVKQKCVASILTSYVIAGQFQLLVRR